MKTFLFASLFGILFASCSTTTYAVDLKDVEKQLNTTGAEGWIHGAVADQQMYVFTYRNPTNFFDYVEMSLVATDPNIMKQLATFDRHDKVNVKGAFLDNPSPQKHIKVSAITMVKKYQSTYQVPAYEHEAKIPDDLLHKDMATFMVHAIAGDGHILVVEYKDAVLPIYVVNADLTKGLFRNDIVQIKFLFQDYPDHPVHLAVNESATDALKVIDSIQAKNGKSTVLEGALILFPKSPEINFNVFAVQEELTDGLKRQYTLVNFDSTDTFQKIRDALQKAWDKYPGAYVNGRNKLVSTRLRVKATGTFNEVDPSQANPQILLNSVDSIEIEE
jgi:hypothetical protein